MKTLGAWFLWTIFSGTAAAVAWRKIQRHFKVYLLILMSGIYLFGIFVIYALLKSIPVY